MVCCGIICYQDIKKRTVYWFLFPMLAVLMGCLHYQFTVVLLFFTHILLNTLLISLILLILYLYTKIVSKKKFINHSFGLGDLLFFYAMAIGFPTLTFIVLFSCALLFSTLIFFSFKNNMTKKTVPLAGFMSLFLSAVFCYAIFFNSPPLYYI